MRKLIAGLIVLLLCLPAIAGAEHYVIDVEFDGVEVAFESLGFSIQIPVGWQQQDLLDQVEEPEEGDVPPLLVEVFHDADNTTLLQLIAWPAEVFDPAAIEAIEAAYADSGEWIVMNDNRMFVFVQADHDVAGAYVITDTLVLSFLGSPIRDADDNNIIGQIMASLQFIP